MTPKYRMLSFARDGGCRTLGKAILLAWLATLGIGVLNLDVFLSRLPHWELMVMVIGGLVGLTRAAWLLWLANSLLFAGYLVVAFTPVTRGMLSELEESDELQPAEAVVVLASAHVNDTTISARAQDRLLHAFELLHRGYGARLVLTRPAGEAAVWPELVRRQMQGLGLAFPIDEVGPVRDTRDEALVVARLAREKGWDRVILVTHAWHMHRSAGLFREAGLPVICACCTDSAGDFQNLDSPDDRLRVFGYWLHEKVGYWLSKWKGWL